MLQPGVWQLSAGVLRATDNMVKGSAHVCVITATRPDTNQKQLSHAALLLPASVLVAHDS